MHKFDFNINISDVFITRTVWSAIAAFWTSVS